MNSKFLILTFVLILLLSTNAYSQVYYFKGYSTSDGLVQGTVKTIYEDSKGRMWFGTAEGVSIYDGTEFSNYGIAEGFSRPVITSFYEISPGIMLVGTLGDGLVVFIDPPFSTPKLKTKITSKKYVNGIYITQIKADKNGNVYICTENGITIWKMEANKIVAIESIDTFGEFGNPSLFQIEFYNNENFYAATNYGLIKKTITGYELVKYKNQTISEPVFTLFTDSKGLIWYSTSKELYFIENNVVRNFSEVNRELEDPVYCFAENKNKVIYFGSIDGIIQVSGSNIIHIDKNNGLQNKDIISLFSDSENNLWIGSLSGISKLTSSSFNFVNTESFKGHFTNILKDGSKLYAASNEGLFEINDYDLKKSQLIGGVKSKIINHLCRDGNNNLWISTDAGVYRKNNSTIINYRDSEGLPHNYTYQIAVDKKDIVWIATQRGLAYIKENRIYDFDKNVEKEWKFSDEEAQRILTTQSIRKVIVDNDNSVWIGSWNGGLFRLKDNSIYRFTQKDGLLDLSIRGIQIDAQKHIWVSTRYGGAFKFDGNSFENFNTKNGLKSNWVFSVEADNNQNLWFCTANGLTKYDEYKSVNYDASDGIISAEIISSIKFQGKLWFISNSQIFTYEPEKVVGQFTYPKILFRQIKLIDGDLPLDHSKILHDTSDINLILANKQSSEKTVYLEHYQNSLVFDFAGIDFRDENRITYDFILEGFDKVWTRSSNKNYLTYTHLPPGKYSFKVHAMSKEGIKSLHPAVFEFEILSPYYYSWWFIGLVVLFFILVVSFANYIIYQYKIKQALRLERLRSDISTDLHDEIGTSLSSIAIFAELVKRDSTTVSTKNSDMLGRIENTSRDLIDKMSDIVWAINPGNDKFEDALFKLKDYSVKILESRGINVDLNFDTGDNEINFTDGHQKESSINIQGSSN